MVADPLTVNTMVVSSIPARRNELFLFPFSCDKTKCSVEFCHSTCNISKNWRCLGTECLYASVACAQYSLEETVCALVGIMDGLHLPVHVSHIISSSFIYTSMKIEVPYWGHSCNSKIICHFSTL